MLFFRHDKSELKTKQGKPLSESHEGPPDSSRPSGLCPRCGKQSSFEVLGSLPVTVEYDAYTVKHDGTHDHDSLEQVSSLICRNCGQGTAVIEERWVGDARWRERKTGGILSSRGIHWWPIPEAQLPPDIPSAIADTYAEASRALSANCPRASAVMARRTLEAIALEKGESSGELAKRLAALASKGTLHPTLAEWAREIRLLGNVGGHFDPMDTVSVDDARKLLDFERELLRYLYELPANLDRLRSRAPQPPTGAT